MTSEYGICYLELPGEKIRGTFKQRNLVVCQPHRDVCLSIIAPENAPLRVSCVVPDTGSAAQEKNKFYIPQKKCLHDEYLFNSGEPLQICLPKSDAVKLNVEYKVDGGWKLFHKIDPTEMDGVNYSNLLSKPAPIIINMDLSDGKVPPTIPCDKWELCAQYKTQTERAKNLSADDMVALEDLQKRAAATETSQSLAARWGEGQFPAGVKKISCHAYGSDPANLHPPVANEETTNGLVVEVFHGTELHAFLKSRGDMLELVVTASNVDMAIEALATAGLEYLDKGKLAAELKGVNFFIRREVVKGEVKTFLILRGDPALRKVLPRSLYLVTNPKVFTLAANYALSKGYLAQVAGNMKNIVSGSGGIATVFLLAADTVIWMRTDGENAARLIAACISTITSIIITGILSPLITAVVTAIAAGLGATAGAVTFLVGGAIIIVSIMVSIALSLAGYENLISDALNKAWDDYCRAWQKLNNDLYDGLMGQHSFFEGLGGEPGAVSF